MSGKLEKCLVTIGKIWNIENLYCYFRVKSIFFYSTVKCAINRPMYIAELLRHSMSGMGTKDEDLIFLVVTESEVVFKINFIFFEAF